MEQQQQFYAETYEEPESKGGIIDYFQGVSIPSPRISGLKALGLGIVILGINIVTLFMDGTYYPVILPFGFPCVFAGFWMTLLGQPRSAEGAPAMWARLIVGLAGLLGILLGLGAAIALC